jgi:TetR/AcrR family transcriptional repressor of nem operon
MPETTSTIGRPRSFDEDDLLDQVVDLFWCHGASGTTTRILEAELGVRQSSLYNAFGSKNRLLLRAIDRYNERIDRALVEPIDNDNAGESELVDFIGSVLDWITTEDHPGCLLLNTLGEVGAADDDLVERARAYRQRVRSVLARVLDNMGVQNPNGRAELLLGGLMGLNISAYGGAGTDELDLLAESLRVQIREWAAS